MKNEVYIILKNDVCNDIGSISIEEVACGLDVARKLFKKHIKQIKSDCDYGLQ